MIKSVIYIISNYFINNNNYCYYLNFLQTVMREGLAVTDHVENKLSMPHQLLWSEAALFFRYLSILDL